MSKDSGMCKNGSVDCGERVCMGQRIQRGRQVTTWGQATQSPGVKAQRPRPEPLLQSHKINHSGEACREVTLTLLSPTPDTHSNSRPPVGSAREKHQALCLSCLGPGTAPSRSGHKGLGTGLPASVPPQPSPAFSATQQPDDL